MGRWRNFAGETSQVVLTNPSSVSRDAVVIFYDDAEQFKACQVERLSPHDMESVTAPALGYGALQVRVGRLAKEPIPGGLIGYVEETSAGTTRALAPLFLGNPDSFSVAPWNLEGLQACACAWLSDKQSPLGKEFLRK